MRRLRGQWILGAALAAATMVSAPVARAADAPAASGDSAAAKPAADAKDANADVKDAKADAKDAKAEDKKDDNKSEGETSKIFLLDLDMVFGSGHQTFVNNVIPPGSTNGLTGVTTLQSGRVTSYSFVLDGDVRLTEGFGVGLRVPFVGGTLFADPTRSDGGLGSVEVGAGGRLKLADMLALELSLGVSLPTATGQQVPATAAQVPIVQGAVDQPSFDRFAVVRAASQARGYEDDELFQPQHLGINPKVRLIAGTEGKWHVDPWIKLDNLIATSSSYSFIGEFLFGVNVGGFLIPELEPVLRFWANVPLTGADFGSTVAVLEPQLRFHFGPVTPYVGGILPVAGSSLTSPYDFGVRVGAGARF